MGLLAALVWAIKPSRPGFKPAPLRPESPNCPKLLQQFTPTNLTDAAALPSAPSLSKEQKDRALFRLNMQPCPCGCNRSLIACRTDYRRCATSERLTQEVVADKKAGAGPSEKH